MGWRGRGRGGTDLGRGSFEDLLGVIGGPREGFWKLAIAPIAKANAIFVDLFIRNSFFSDPKRI